MQEPSYPKSPPGNGTHQINEQTAGGTINEFGHHISFGEAVRVWLRIRSDQHEPGFVDGHTYRYGNVEYTPTGNERNFRRVLLSRTILLRNARTL